MLISFLRMFHTAFCNRLRSQNVVISGLYSIECYGHI